MRNRIFGIIYAVELIWAVLYNLHYAGMWPKTWSMTNLLLLLCVYAAVIVLESFFAFVCPCDGWAILRIHLPHLTPPPRARKELRSLKFLLDCIDSVSV